MEVMDPRCCGVDGTASPPNDCVDGRDSPLSNGESRSLPPTLTNSSCSQGAFGSILDAECSIAPRPFWLHVFDFPFHFNPDNTPLFLRSPLLVPVSPDTNCEDS